LEDDVVMRGSDSIVHTARRYWDAEESRDIERILSAFHPEATWTGPTGGVLRGREEIRSYYEKSAAEYPGLVVTIGRTYTHADEGAIEWSAELRSPDGSPTILKGVNLMTQADGLITSLTAYFDASLYS
jgi:uncharacterized protein (TIGR02246 family)